MKAFFIAVLYRPLFNALAWLYLYVAFEDLGIAIIVLTLAVRLLLFPLFHRTAKHQQVTQNLQPEIRKIQQKHKEDKETQAKELMALYNRHEINPMTPLLALLIQIPIIIVLYQIFIHGFSEDALQLLYPFVHLPQAPNQTLLGVVDLTQSSLWIAILAAVAQFFQARVSMASVKRGGGDSKAERITRAMLFAMPVITLLVLISLPAAIGIYWLVTTVFSVFQQVMVKRSLNKEPARELSLGENGEGKRQD